MDEGTIAKVLPLRKRGSYSFSGKTEKDVRK